MRVDVKTITRNIGDSLEIKVTGSPEEIALSSQEYAFMQPVEFEGIVRNADKDVMVLQGTVRTSVASRCARCLKDVVSQIEATLDVTYRSQYFRDAHPGEDADPEEEYTFDGYSIELDRAIRDSLILSLPFRTLCEADCKGICEWCGTNLNEKDCQCKESHGNGSSLFEELRKLL